MNPAPMLQVRDLAKTFARTGNVNQVIAGLSMDISEGEFVSIVGPSGCGKSTFLHMVGGFEAITSGTLTMHGQPILGPAPDRGMMFQDFSLYPWLTVLQNVAWPLEIKGVPKTERLARAGKILETVNLKRYAGYYPAQLSGGMKQRVALARLLALDSEMLLMDEPFGALDAQTRELLQEELQSVWQRLGQSGSRGESVSPSGNEDVSATTTISRKTVLFVTHDIDEAIFLSTRILVFAAHPGRIKADVTVPARLERGAEFRKSAQYHEIRNHVWDLLREEVVKVKALEQDA
jgi:NitT/TauT family transport system ATP-binding protein